MKIKILLLMLLLFLPVTFADTYLVDTVKTCDGMVLVNMYYDEPYNFIGCKENGWFYECPCAKDMKIILNSTITKREKIIVEYYINSYKDPNSRVTKEIYVEPTQADEKKIEYEIKLEKRNLILVVIIVLTILSIISVATGVYLKKMYIRLKMED